jgi:NAD(P)H-nitrite reductase large subunit
MENNEKIICTCMEVTENEVIDAIKNCGCNTVEKVGEKTGAGTVCGGCIEIIERLIETENS